MTLRHAASLVLLVFTGACAAHPAPATAPAPAAAAVKMPAAIRWFRASAEQRAAYLEVYRLAGQRVSEEASGQPTGRWGVILDADETVLDNSQFEGERARTGEPFTESAWARWVHRRAATALPGSLEFTREVKQLGGAVVIVTNRADSLCPDTRANLLSLGVPADAVLCAPAGMSDKNPRFKAVEAGTGTGLPPLRIVAWVGDNIQDFPGMKQAAMVAAADSAFALFGRRYFLLPNPMYGSW